MDGQLSVWALTLLGKLDVRARVTPLSCQARVPGNPPQNGTGTAGILGILGTMHTNQLEMVFLGYGWHDS
jgi:hypothetical protein